MNYVKTFGLMALMTALFMAERLHVVHRHLQSPGMYS